MSICLAGCWGDSSTGSPYPDDLSRQNRRVEKRSAFHHLTRAETAEGAALFHPTSMSQILNGSPTAGDPPVAASHL